MWVYSPFDFKAPIVWGGEKFLIKKGVNELPDDVGRAYFLYDFRLAPEQELILKGKTKEEREYVFDETLMIALGHTLRRHGKTKDEADFLKQFICTKTREEVEAKLKELTSDNKPQGK